MPAWTLWLSPHEPCSGSDNRGRPPQPKDQGSDQESLVRLLPTSPICPLARLRQGRWRPDQSVPWCGNVELSRCPEIGSSEGRGMNQAHCRHRHAGRTPRVGTGAGPQVRVTLSDDLLNHLRQTAQQKRVPLRWLGRSGLRHHELRERRTSGPSCRTWGTMKSRGIHEKAAAWSRAN